MDSNSSQAPNSKKIWYLGAGVLVFLVAGYLLNSTFGFIGRKATENNLEKVIEKSTGGKANVDLNNGEVNIKTDEGSASTADRLPDNWPSDAPAYPGAKIEYSGTKNNAGVPLEGAVIFVTSDSAQKAMDFYKAELVAKGWGLADSVNAGGTLFQSATKDTRQITVTIASADGQTRITISVSNK